jgi:hypothetical protein
MEHSGMKNSVLLHNETSTTEAVHKLNQEIDRLTELQSAAMRTATFVGMTADEAKDYDARRAEILLLVQHLTALTQSQ